MPKLQWVYRPTEEEHEQLLRALARQPEYTSVSQFIREGVLRLVHDNDRRKLYTEAAHLIDELKSTKDKFMSLVLSHSEEVTEDTSEYARAYSGETE